MANAARSPERNDGAGQPDRVRVHLGQQWGDDEDDGPMATLISAIASLGQDGTNGTSLPAQRPVPDPDRTPDATRGLLTDRRTPSSDPDQFPVVAVSPYAPRTARSPRRHRHGTDRLRGRSGCATPIVLHCARFDIRDASASPIGRIQDGAAVSRCGSRRIAVCWGVSNGAPHLSICMVRICAASGAQFGSIHRFAQKCGEMQDASCAAGPNRTQRLASEVALLGRTDGPARRGAARGVESPCRADDRRDDDC